MQRVDYKDKQPRPEKTRNATESAVRNAVHVASLLKSKEYPGG